jgi:DNA-binding NarL/FixJ family response regulator
VGAELASRQVRHGADRVKLSTRETQVLQLVATGYTNAEVAAELGIGLRTVEAHRSSALRKLGLRTRADIVRYCWDAGLLRHRPQP